MESRTDSINYSDPSDVMSASEETEADELRAHQIEGFFDNFNLNDDECFDALSTIYDNCKLTIQSQIVCVIKHNNYKGSDEINKDIRGAAKQYAEGCIDNNNIFWNCDE